MIPVTITGMTGHDGPEYPKGDHVDVDHTNGLKTKTACGLQLDRPGQSKPAHLLKNASAATGSNKSHRSRKIQIALLHRQVLWSFKEVLPRK
jgi:hypothetical protein